MYITETTDNVRKLFEGIDELQDDFTKMKFLIYIFGLLNNNQINDENEANPELIEKNIKVFDLNMNEGLDNFTMTYLNKLVMTYNNYNSNKVYLENGNVMGMIYNEEEKKLLSFFEKLNYNEKLDSIAEIFIRLDNDSLFIKKYIPLYLNVNGFNIAKNIIDYKNKL